MAKYKITAPDGRVVTISGDHAPTENDLQSIFASLPPAEQTTPTEQPQTKRVPVTNGVNRIAQVGADSFPVLGKAFVPFAAATDATYDYLLDKMGAGNVVPQKPDGTPASWRERYERAKGQYKKEIAETRESHPYLSLGAELTTGAGLPLGAASKANTLGQAVSNAAKVAIPLGALDAGIRSDGDLKDRIAASGLGAVMGGAGAAAFGGAGYGISKAGTKIGQIAEQRAAQKLVAALNRVPTDGKFNLSKRQTKMLAEDVGGRDILDALITKAKDQGVSLAEVGDTNISRVLEKANQVSPTARRTIANSVESRAKTTPSETAAVFDETLGLKKGLQSLDILESDYAKQAKPLYAKAFKHKVDGKTLMELQKNTLINDAMTDVNKNTGSYFGGRSNVEADSVEYLDGLKRSIDNRINAEINSKAADMKKVAFLEEARDEILKAADNVAPTYRYARNTSSNKFEIGDAYSLGERVFDGHMTTEQFINKVKEINKTPAARDALKMGVRSILTDKLGAKTSEATTFSKLMTPNAQAKIKALIGDKEGQRLIDYARRQYNWNQTMNKATQGSPTAGRLQLAEEAVGPVANLVRGNPVAAVGQVLGNVLQKGAKAIGRASDDANYTAITNALLNPASDIGMQASRLQPVYDNVTVAILRALGLTGRGVGTFAPYLEQVPARATGITNTQLLKALGY